MVWVTLPPRRRSWTSEGIGVSDGGEEFQSWAVRSVECYISPVGSARQPPFHSGSEAVSNRPDNTWMDEEGVAGATDWSAAHSKARHVAARLLRRVRHYLRPCP